MSEEKKNVNQADFNQFFAVLSQYVQYCIINSKDKLTNKEMKVQSEKRIQEKEELIVAFEKYTTEKENFQQSYDAMCDAIKEGGIQCLRIYVDALKKLYVENTDWKKEIKAVLVGQKSLKLFKAERSNIMELYPILDSINKTFPVDDYAVLSLSPKAHLYGSEVNKTKNGSTKIEPCSNVEIQRMLELFLQVKDYKRFDDWIMAVLLFKDDDVDEVFRKDYAKQRVQLIEWTYKQISTNEPYRRAVIDVLLKNKFLDKLFDAYIEQPVHMKKLEELEATIKKLEEVNEQEKISNEDRRLRQFKVIQEKEAELENFRERLRLFDKAKEQLDSYTRKYEAQVEMNESIIMTNKLKLREIETDYDHMNDELSAATSELEQMKTKYEALLSDLSLKNNEIIRLKEISLQKEASMRIDIMRVLVSGINEQFFYQTLFYMELKETGRLAPESIDLYGDTLNNIDKVLEQMGIKKIGIIDNIVEYDSSIHISTDAKLANGEKVTISGYGWKIGEEVYIKAPVEKGE